MYNENEIQPAMGGFFSWLSKTCKKIAPIVALVNPTIGSALYAIGDATDGDGKFFGITISKPVATITKSLGAGIPLLPTSPVIPIKSPVSGNPIKIPGSTAADNQLEIGTVAQESNGDIELTEEEEIKLDKWVDQFLTMFKYQVNNLSATQDDPILFMDAVNETVKFLEATQMFIDQGVPVGGWSESMIASQKQFLEIQAESLKQAIESIITGKGYVYDIVGETRKLSTVTYGGSGFKFNGTLTYEGDLYVLPETDNPIDDTIETIGDTIGDVIDTGTEIIGDIQDGLGDDTPENTATPTTGTTTKGKTPVWLWLIGAALTIKALKK